MIWLRALATLAIVLGVTAAASANDVIAPNANTAVEGNAGTVIITQSTFTFQWVFAASQFSSIPTGSLITGIGFRLDAGSPNGPAAPINLTQWDLQLSQSLNAPGSLNTVFASNIAADVVLVRSGALNIPINFFTGGAGPNPIANIAFTTPYMYTGGDLLMTLREAGGTASLVFDAVSLPLAVTDSVGVGDVNGTSGTAHFFNVPVTSFTFAPASVPEPTTLALVGVGAAGAVAARKLRGRFGKRRPTRQRWQSKS